MVCLSLWHVYLVVFNRYLSILFLGVFRHDFVLFFFQNVVFRVIPHFRDLRGNSKTRKIRDFNFCFTITETSCRKWSQRYG